MPRVVRLEVPGLIRKQRVRRGVGLVETVAGEELDELEDLVGLLFADSALGTTGHEAIAGGRHLLLVLFAHRAAQLVGLSQRKTCQVTRQAHNLFLIRDDAVRFLERRLHGRRFVFDLGAAVFAIDVVVHNAAAQRAGTIQRVQRDQVLETLRLGLAQRLAHAGTFKLEHTVCLAVGKQLIRLRVVERQMIEVDLVAGGFLDVFDGVVEQRERAEAEEVHLEQTHPLNFLHRPLCGDFVLLAAIERRKFHHGPGSNDDAGGVHGGVTCHAFETTCDLQQLADPFILALELGQRRDLLDGFVEGHVERRGNQLRDLVHLRDRELHHTTDVTHDGLGLHGTERDDLGDVFAAVFLCDVLDDLAAATFTEVDVDIGERHTLRVQESFEVEIEVQRIDVGDPHAVGHEAAGGRASPGSDGNVLVACITDEVPHDQEVPGVLHLLDHVDLVLEPRLVFRDGATQFALGEHRVPALHPFGKSLPHGVLKIRVGGEPGRHVEVGQVVDVFRNVYLAPLRDTHGVAHGVGMITEHLLHLGHGLQEELIAVILETFFVARVFAGADTQQDVVRVLVRVLEVVDVVGGHQRHVEVARNRQQSLVDDALLLDALVLHLEEEVIGTQDVAIGRCGFKRLARLVGANARGHFPFEATAEADQPLAVLREQRLVDAGFVIKPLGVPGRHQPHEVVETFRRLREEHEVVGGFTGCP